MEHIFQNIEGWFTFPTLYVEAVNKYDNAKFIEIGTWLGQSASYMAVEIANSNKKIEFFCVDTWNGSLYHKDHDLVKNDTLYETFINNIKLVEKYIKPLRMTSVEASKKFKDNYFDFIFIDGDHEYDSVKDDISHWFPKLKKGGIISGHDYRCGWPGVDQAVDEWAEKNNFNIQHMEHCWVYLNE